MSNAESAHGTIIKRNGVAIAEVRDITLPPFMLNTFDTSNQNDADDSYIPGINRKGEMTFSINYISSGEATHNSSAGLLNAYKTRSKDRYDVVFPTYGASFIFSGFLTNLAIKAPVDGPLTADITVRPTGATIYNP